MDGTERLFAYTVPEVRDQVAELEAGALENLPQGLDGSAYGSPP